jgi:HSP20 family protein
MLSRYTPFDRTMALMNELSRRMDRAFDSSVQFAPAGSFEEPWALSEATWPGVSLHDTGAGLLFTAEVPGLSAGDLKIQLENDVLTVSGERKVQVPQGYAAHRRERGNLSFSRSFNLPVRVDAERTTAALKDGVLTLDMPKVPESQPRQISIKTAS